MRELDDLDLDLRNVRIPVGDLNESAIARYLVEAADLLDLATDILRDGYLDNELPVVTAENGRHVVLEGNRRITALKAIHDPSLLGKYAAKAGTLAQQLPGQPRRPPRSASWSPRRARQPSRYWRGCTPVTRKSPGSANSRPCSTTRNCRPR